MYKDGTAYTRNGNAVTKTVAPDSEGNWTWNTNYNLPDGEYTIVVTAIDEAGNIKEVNTSGTYSLTIDNTLPTSSLLKASGTLYNADGSTITAANATLTDGGKYYAKEAYTISGVIEEQNYDNTKVTLSSNGTIPAIVKTDKNWSFEGNTTNGTHTYTLRIEDKAGNVNTHSITVIYDTIAPAPAVTNPEPVESGTITLSSDKYIFSGLSNDDNILTSRYLITQENYTDAQILSNGSSGTGWNTTSSSNGSWATSEMTLVSGTSSTTGQLHEGTWYIYMYAKDILGHEGTSKATFWVDKNKPTVSISISDKATGENTARRTGFTLSGSAEDVNGIDSVTISDSLGASNTEVTYNASSKKWEKEYTISSLTDGFHKFTVTATDKAGQKKEADIEVTVDKEKPTIPQLLDSALPGKDDTKGSSFTFTGSASDATSGIQEIQLTISGNGYSRTVKASGTENWSAKVTYADTATTGDLDGTANSWSQIFATQGVKTVTVKAIDNAGNEQSTTAQTFTYDKADPTITVDTTTIKQFMSSDGLTLKVGIKDTYGRWG